MRDQLPITENLLQRDYPRAGQFEQGKRCLESIAESRGDLAGRGARAIASGTTGLLLRRIPLVGPALRRALEAPMPEKHDALAAEQVPSDSATPTRNVGPTSLALRGARAVAGAARAAGQGWLEALLAAFDRRWVKEMAQSDEGGGTSPR